MNQLAWNLVEEWVMEEGRIHYILGRIQELVHTFFNLVRSDVSLGGALQVPF